MADEPNRPDLVALVSGLITVTIAGTVLFGLGGQLQWLLAVAAVMIGGIMLIASRRTRNGS
ncbi:hypothetical protein [Saccharopolyspora sp. NPDC002376]